VTQRSPRPAEDLQVIGEVSEENIVARSKKPSLERAASLVSRAQAILSDKGSVDPELRGTAYRKAGWTRFDKNAPPFTTISKPSLKPTAT
jgi:hypothetical protein